MCVCVEGEGEDSMCVWGGEGVSELGYMRARV